MKPQTLPDGSIAIRWETLAELLEDIHTLIGWAMKVADDNARLGAYDELAVAFRALTEARLELAQLPL